MESNEEEGVCYAQPVTLEDRLNVVRDFVQRNDYRIPIAIDPIENPANQIYAGWPERLYIVGEDGAIAYKGKTGPFGYHPEEVAAWLLKRFPPETAPAGGVGAERIATEPLAVRAVEYAKSRVKWRLAIDAAGNVAAGRDPDPQPRALDPAHVAALRRMLADQRFFDWPEVAGEPTVDGAARSLAVTLGSTVKIVQVYASSDGEPAPGTAPFEEVWGLLRSFAP